MYTTKQTDNKNKAETADVDTQVSRQAIQRMVIRGRERTKRRGTGWVYRYRKGEADKEASRYKETSKDASTIRA